MDEDVVSAWLELERKLPRRPEQITSAALPFIEYGWSQFNVAYVLELLMSDRPSYAGHRDILFAGLCLWLLRPGTDRMRQQAMRLVALEYLVRAEKTGRELYPSYPFLADIAGRVEILDPNFYDEFYYPVGGLSTFIDCPTRRSFRKRIQKRSDELYTVSAMMKILDYRIRCIPFTKEWYNPTENMGYKLVSDIYHAKLLRGHAGAKEAKVRWLQYRDRASLIYAASTIKFKDGDTLLERICKGKIFSCPQPDRISVLVGRARFASNTIISKLKGEAITAIEPYIDMTGPILEIDLPQYNDENQAIIRQKFSQKVTLASRSGSRKFPMKGSE